MIEEFKMRVQKYFALAALEVQEDDAKFGFCSLPQSLSLFIKIHVIFYIPAANSCLQNLEFGYGVSSSAPKDHALQETGSTKSICAVDTARNFACCIQALCDRLAVLV